MMDATCGIDDCITVELRLVCRRPASGKSSRDRARVDKMVALILISLLPEGKQKGGATSGSGCKIFHS